MRLAYVTAFCALAAHNLPAQNWNSIDSVFARKGSPQAGDVVKYSFPRSDLDVTANGLKLEPAFALGSWVAFKRISGGSMAMGDLVLTSEEVSRVIVKLQAAGIDQTALHNHLLGESPRVMYMHISAHGDPLRIAQGIHAALAVTGTPPAASAAAAPPPVEIDTAAVAAALGYHGRMSGRVYQVSVPRRERVVENGMEIPASMGLATAINFQPAGPGKAAITGDFVMTADEVNRVIRALEKNNIQPTGLHSHMLDETPRLFFMHFWGSGDAVSLAKGLSAALKEMDVSR